MIDEAVKGEELDDDEFIKMLSDAAVVVLPYAPKDFSNRTSGLLIDCIHLGIPVVVIRGTWLGNLVSRLRMGVVVSDATGTSLAEGVRKVLARQDKYSAAARRGRKFIKKGTQLECTARRDLERSSFKRG